jgi:glycosyltransferase involved in cell wall biosynthesis
MAEGRIHVLFVAGWWDPFGDFIKEQAYSVARYCQVTYIYIEFNKSSSIIPLRVKRIRYEKHGVNHLEARIYCPMRRFGIYEFVVRRIYSVAIKNAAPVDLIHINVRTPITEVIGRQNRRMKLPVALTEHSSFYHHGILQRFKGPQLEAERKRITDWFADSGFKRIIAVSAHLLQVLRRQYQVSEKLLQKIPNVSAPEFHYREHPANEKITLLLAARWETPKNPMLFLKALECAGIDLGTIRIQWVGEGSLLNEVIEFIREKKMELNVSFPGSIREREVMAGLYREADIFVHPTDNENLPCVILESLCCGTPVLSNSVGGVPEMINEANGMLSPPGDISAFAENLKRMIEKRNAYDRRSISAEALKIYSPDVIGKQLFDVYCELISRE